eukprot:jgi/Picre1/32578/NNA_007924.t1
MVASDKYTTGPNGEKRLKGVELSVPIVTGTVAISLGKKATDYATHSWTVFENPNREVTMPPFELRETGWGEFDILIEIHFRDDANEPPLELLHSLRLGLDIHGNPQRRPHTYEKYEEVVFWEPTVALHNALQGGLGRAPESSVEQYFGTFDPEADYQLVQAGRKRLAKHFAMLKAKLATLEAEEEVPAPL